MYLSAKFFWNPPYDKNVDLRKAGRSGEGDLNMYSSPYALHDMPYLLNRCTLFLISVEF